MVSCMKFPFVLALYLLGLVGTVKGECKGNDSRCANSAESDCKTLGNSGTDCRWVSSGATATSIASSGTTTVSATVAVTTTRIASSETTTMSSTVELASFNSIGLEPEPASFTTSFNFMELESEPAPELEDTTTQPVTSTMMSSSEGDCTGNDSRCPGSSRAQCKLLESQGSDCRWRIRREGVAGSCLGNDSRCANSRQPTCLRLGRQGADCRWESATSTDATSGACAGNDSRCSGKSKTSCDVLKQEGSDCKWRKDFTVSGELTMQVTNAPDFANNPNASAAIEEGIENVTAVPSEYIDLDLYVVPQRRLGGRALQQSGTVIVTYVITVGSDVPASVAVTGSELSNVMQASNIDQIGAAITAKIAETFGHNDFNIVVTKVASIDVISPNNSTTTQAPGLEDSDGALLSRCPHSVLLFLSIAFYLS